MEAEVLFGFTCKLTLIASDEVLVVPLEFLLVNVKFKTPLPLLVVVANTFFISSNLTYGWVDAGVASPVLHIFRLIGYAAVILGLYTVIPLSQLNVFVIVTPLWVLDAPE